ncbi:MAG: hypothetical protein JWQ43_1617 [Glaciihabitans sp.]|nr:hypothetical protein [Glaciihabitans sp.]
MSLFAVGGAAVRAAAGTVPVGPDADEARRWMLRELSKPEYQAARPTWFDRLASAVRDWFLSLNFGGASGPPVLGIVIVIAVVVVLLLVAFLVFGLPRLRRRSALAGELFGVDDTRSAAALRGAAEQLAAAGNYAEATAEMFRAIARGLSERVITSTTPGTTARAFAGSAALAFPDHRAGLDAAATAFDDVRYLGRPGSQADYNAVAELESRLRMATPQLQAATV